MVFWAEAFSDWTSSHPPRAPRPPWSPATPRITTRRHQRHHHREGKPSRQRTPRRERKAEEDLLIRFKIQSVALPAASPAGGGGGPPNKGRGPVGGLTGGAPG